MPVPTLAQLRTSARTRANQDDSDFPTTAQYNQYIGEAALDVFGDLVTSGYPVDFDTTTITANGASTYPVAGVVPLERVFGVVGVYSLVGGVQSELKRVNEGNRAALRSSGTTGSPAEYYDLRQSFTGGTRIELLPKPTSGTYLVDWIPDFEGLVLDADTWAGPARSDELIVIAAARKAVLKEGRIQDASVLKNEYDELLDKVKRMGSWLDMRNPAQVRDVGPTRAARSSFDYAVVGPDWVG